LSSRRDSFADKYRKPINLHCARLEFPSGGGGKAISQRFVEHPTKDTHLIAGICESFAIKSAFLPSHSQYLCKSIYIRL